MRFGRILVAQIALGAMNVILLAPVWLQMTHLLAAEMFWIFLVLESADQLLANHNPRVALFRKGSDSAQWNFGLKAGDHIGYRGGHSV